MRNWLWFAVVAGCSSSGGLSGGPARVLGAGYAVDGVTDNGKLVVIDKNKMVSAVGMGGGALTAIGPASNVAVWHNVVFLFSAPDANYQTGTIATWTATGGLHTLGTGVQYQTPYLSNDGQWLVYFDNLSTDGKLGDMISSRVDGSGRQVLETQIPISDCYPWAESFGSAWVLDYCKSYDTTTGMGDGELERFDPASNQRSPLLTMQPYGAPYATMDKTETHMFAVDSNGNAQVFDSSGHATAVDINVASGYIAPDGSVVYTTFMNELKHWNGNATTLTTVDNPQTGLLIFDELSPDGKTVLFTQAFGQTSGQDLWAASAVTPSEPRAVLAMPTGAPGTYLNGSFSSFTKDSSHILFIDPQDQNFIGPLHVIPTQGGTATLLGDKIIYALTTHDAQLVYCGNDDSTQHECDLFSVDAVKPDKPTQLAAHAGEYNLFQTADGKQLVYSVKSGADEGVWVVPTP